MSLSAGARLGPYEVVGLVGSGGMGAVYRARDPRLGRDVAVKVIAMEGPPSAERLRRFEDEARAVASLSHPNVLTVFDVGELAAFDRHRVEYVLVHSMAMAAQGLVRATRDMDVFVAPDAANVDQAQGCAARALR